MHPSRRGGHPTLEDPSHDSTVTGLLCVADETKHTNWRYVGEGKGGYTQDQVYNYVGDGSGAFSKSERKYYSNWRPRVCTLAIVASLILLILLGALVHLLGEGFDSDQGEAESTANTSPAGGLPARAAPPASASGGGPAAAMSSSPNSLKSEGALQGTPAAAAASGTTVGAAALAAAAAAATHDCMKGFRTGWTVEKQTWCCQNTGMGCPPSNVIAPLPGVGRIASKLQWCQTLCVLDDVNMDCAARINSAAGEHAQQPNSCQAAYEKVVKACSFCSVCELQASGCLSGPK